MLVLTRKPGQSLYIGDDIKITLHGIRGNQVRLGIDAPSSVKIYREEIYLQILEENKEAYSKEAVDLEGVARAWADKKHLAINTLSKQRQQGRGVAAEDDEDE